MNEAGFALFMDLLELAQRGGQDERMRAMIDEHRGYSLEVLQQVVAQLRTYGNGVT